MTRDMTCGSPLRHIVAFSWPLFVGNIIQCAYSLTDAILVGRLLGETALAAVGGVTSMLFVVLGFVFGLSSGVGVVVAQRFGAHDSRGVRLAVGTGVWVCGVVTVLISGLCLLGTEVILFLMETPHSIYEQARTYLQISFYGIVFMAFFNFQSAVLRAFGDSQTPLYCLVGASLLNVLLDVIFVTVFEWGVAGAAGGTKTAGFFSAFCFFVAVTRRLSDLRLRLSEWRPRRKLVRVQLSIGIPMGLQFSITGLGALVLQRAINTFGVAQMAGMTAARNVEMIAVQLPVALGQAMATYSAQNFGAGQLTRIRQGVRTSILLVVLSGASLTVLTVLFSDVFIALFLQGASATVTEAFTVGRKMLSITAPFFIPLGTIFIFRNTLQGVGHSFWPMVAGVVEMVMRAGVALVLLPVLGVHAVYWGDPCAWVGASFLLWITYAVIAWHWPERRGTCKLV